MKAHGSVEIPLKDDDPAALTTICHGLHFCHDQIDLNISLADLTTVADLADKYELGAALRPIAELWITKRLENMQEADYHDLLVAAHLLRHERMFETVAERMVWDASGAGFETALDKSVQDSPEIINLFRRAFCFLRICRAVLTFADALYRQRKEAVTTIMSLVEHIVDNDLYLGLEPVAFCAMGHQCTYVQRRV